MKIKFLLVDPTSVFHGPPSDLKVKDKSLADLYSSRLDDAVNKKLCVESKSNWNAVSTKYVTNYGLLMLGHLIKKKGYFVDYINGDYYSDSNEFFNNVVTIMGEYDVICMTGTTPQFSEMKCLASELRNKGYNNLLVYGGPHSYFFKSNYEDTDFDIIFVGHNLDVTIQKIEDTIKGEFAHERGAVKNTIIYEGEGYVDSPKDFSLIPQDYVKETLLYTYSSYGCPNHCRYCAEHYYNPKVCFLDEKKSLEEIEFLINVVGVKSVHLADSDFFLNPSFCDKFLGLIKKKRFKACFTVNTSPQIICKNDTLRLVKKFYDLGLIELLIGVEYFSETVLRKMNKSYDIALFYMKLAEIRKQCPDLIVSFYSLIGLPGSNSDTIIENYNWFKKFYEAKLFDFSFPKFFVPYPGTDVYDHPEDFDSVIVHRNWSDYHRWALPRPIILSELSDDDLLNEVKRLYELYD